MQGREAPPIGFSGSLIPLGWDRRIWGSGGCRPSCWELGHTPPMAWRWSRPCGPDQGRVALWRGSSRGAQTDGDSPWLASARRALQGPPSSGKGHSPGPKAQRDSKVTSSRVARHTKQSRGPASLTAWASWMLCGHSSLSGPAPPAPVPPPRTHEGRCCCPRSPKVRTLSGLLQGPPLPPSSQWGSSRPTLGATKRRRVRGACPLPSWPRQTIWWP